MILISIDSPRIASPNTTQGLAVHAVKYSHYYYTASCIPGYSLIDDFVDRRQQAYDNGVVVGICQEVGIQRRKYTKDAVATPNATTLIAIARQQ